MSTAPSSPNLRWSIQDPTARDSSKPECLLRITPKLALSAAIYVKWLTPPESRSQRRSCTLTQSEIERQKSFLKSVYR